MFRDGGRSLSRKAAAFLMFSLLLGPVSLFPAASPETGMECPRAAAREDLSDEFDGPVLDPKWSWYNSPASYDMGVTTAGHLHLVARRNTNFGQSSDSGALLYQNASGNFSIETKLSSDPAANFEKSGIMVRYNASNWVGLFYQAQSGKKVELTTKIGGSANDNIVDVSASPVWLRLERDGQTFTSYYSTNGTGWTFVWSGSVSLNDPLSIGLIIADGNANADFATDFDYFRVGAPNRPPAITDPFTPVSVREDERLGLDISTHLSDPDGDELVFEVTDSAHIKGAFNETRNDLEVWGIANWNGAEFANIKATDRFGLFIKAQIRVTVTPVPDAPCLLEPIPDINVPQAGANSSLNLSAHFFDNDTLHGGTDALAYSWEGTGRLQVSIAAGGLVTVVAPIDFWGELELSFTATDRTELSATAEARVVVYHVNQAPQARSGPPDTSVREDESVTVFLGPVFWDPDGDPMTFEASGNEQLAVAFELQNATFTPRPDASGFTERVTIRARDDKGLASGPVTVNVTVVPVNDPPRITSYSPPGNVTLRENDGLDFSVAVSDPESGAGVTYAWLLDDVQVATGVTGYKLQTDYGSAGVHKVKVVASDGELSTSLSWEVTVENVNRPPPKATIVSPRPGASFKEGLPITLEGDSSDPDGDLLTFFWYEGLMELGTGRNLSIRLPVGEHKITLEVSDGTASVRSATISVSVKVNAKPTILSLSPEKGQKFARGKIVSVFAEVMDADGDELVYCWTEDGRLIGTNASLTLSGLPVGKHRLQLAVSDGTAVVQQTLDFEVVEPGAAAADYGLYIVGGIAAGVVVSIAIALMARGRKKEPAAPAKLEQPVLKW